MAERRGERQTHQRMLLKQGPLPSQNSFSRYFSRFLYFPIRRRFHKLVFRQTGGQASAETPSFSLAAGRRGQPPNSPQCVSLTQQMKKRMSLNVARASSPVF
jgi:hypothetical protein